MGEQAHLLSNADRVPLYHQIFLILQGKILDGEYGSGDYLPGERELADAYGVSRITAVRALHELAQAGLVVRERGRGTRVQIVSKGSVARGPVGNEEQVQPGLSAPWMQSDAAEAADMAPEISVLEFEYCAAPAKVAEALRIADGTIVQRAVRLLRFQGKPFTHATSYVPQDIGTTWTREDMTNAPMFTLLERARIQIGLIEERVTATLADAAIAERLQVERGAPLILINRITFDAGGRAVDYFTGYYPPDRYQYVVTLPRKTLAAQRPRLRGA